MALIAAATFPDQIAAAASFHPGHLVTDQPSSPHLLVPKIKGKVYVAGAIEDASFTDDMKERLKKALAEAGVDHTVETYPAKHGWVLRDTLAYNPEEAEHHWRALVALMDGVLKR
jgi:carboxymethylenebutenolidase